MLEDSKQMLKKTSYECSFKKTDSVKNEGEKLD